MSDFMLFLHFIGLAVWLGSLVMVAVLLTLLKKQVGEGEQKIVRTVIRVFNMLSHPAAFLVLISGFGMLGMDSGHEGKGMPFWLTYMRDVGTTIIVLSMIVLSILGTKVVNKKPEPGEPAFRKDKLATFLTVELVVIGLILSVLLIASFRF
ncbi:hypothetical protein [Gorillibacterium timonense]|uniref:hypothetical protein n=1 Tax=Gorillibacterium timonense TaxID=1689269 RepID=UPI00071DDB61|nr:hypothetical protein [Gorillibacterium timonense]